MEIYKLKNGRFIIAEWRERNAQYIGHVSPSPWQGYCYSYARNLEALAGVGVTTYARRSDARRALKRRYESF